MYTLPGLFVALDVPSVDDATHLTGILSPLGVGFKFGVSLVGGTTTFLYNYLKVNAFSDPSRIFLDYKLHDVPSTVEAAVKNLISGPCHPGPGIITLHASGGKKMLDAAANVIARANSPTHLAAITVLTSMDDVDCEENYNRPVAEQVALMLEQAKQHGCTALVSSATDLPGLNLGHLLSVTPGIRPAGAEAGTQKRFTTPAEAVRLGSHAQVVGGPIYSSADPYGATQAILKEMAIARTA